MRLLLVFGVRAGTPKPAAATTPTGMRPMLASTGWAVAALRENLLQCRIDAFLLFRHVIEIEGGWTSGSTTHRTQHLLLLLLLLLLLQAA